MRIAQIAPVQGAIPPNTYGGTERVVSILTEALVELGHDVTLYASGDSQTRARLIPTVDEALLFNPSINIGAYHMAALDQVYDEAEQFDIVHSHLDYLTLPFTEHTSIPTVLTLHGRLDLPEYRRIYRRYPQANYVSISESQRDAIPDLNWVATVHHGIDLRAFPFYPDPGEYLVFVGRISPEKRPDRAIKVAQRAGIQLKIAAKVDAKDEEYFHTSVKPLLDHPLIEFVGEVGERERHELMGHALALLLPIDWPEPFGMVFIEAMACGTPVLTCPRGAAPELLQEGITGFLRTTVHDLAVAVGEVQHLSRSACRIEVERRFDMHRMAHDYVQVYSKVQAWVRGRQIWSVPSM